MKIIYLFYHFGIRKRLFLTTVVRYNIPINISKDKNKILKYA